MLQVLPQALHVDIAEDREVAVEEVGMLGEVEEEGEIVVGGVEGEGMEVMMIGEVEVGMGPLVTLLLLRAMVCKLTHTHTHTHISLNSGFFLDFQVLIHLVHLNLLSKTVT